MPFEDTLYMLDSAIRLSFSFEKFMTYFVVIVIIIILIPIVCCIIAACGAKAIIEGDLGKTNGHGHKDPLLAQGDHHNQVYPPPPTQPYMGYPPNANYGNYPPPPPPMYQAPEGAYYPPPPISQGAQYGFPEASAPLLPK
ncbi:hypothetical protein SteCoe_3034 [Stentor coeruleus]|uniref:Uncharacterized protein n=1 Tax=Stentor coeruleus TaxID=5963 RepID=A0A1R2CYB0_9CILI|nr:hypothetical protein SteCoe_3034 [Stentor coeruleus]